MDMFLEENKIRARKSSNVLIDHLLRSNFSLFTNLNEIYKQKEINFKFVL